MQKNLKKYKKSECRIDNFIKLNLFLKFKKLNFDDDLYEIVTI